ncbi:MAG: cation transporter [Gammaproteobacteria bacterium]
MTVKTHRPGINEDFLMIRHLRLEGLDSRKTESITSVIDNIAGIDTVSIKEEKQILDLSYDASQVNIKQIEEIIKQNGCDIAQDWWSRLKEDWYRFTDENAQSNATHRPSCCNKPPRK